jgi:hypothetical protein
MRTIERKVMFRHFFGEDEIEKSIDRSITKLLKDMDDPELNSIDFEACMASLERLTEIKANRRKSAVSRDTIALIAGNLIGIVLIMVYEQKHVMTSKSFSQLIKPR